MRCGISDGNIMTLEPVKAPESNFVDSGIMEQWNIGILGIKYEVFLLLFL
jgi:hypothetical protein